MPLEPIDVTLEKIFTLSPTVKTFRLRFPKDKWIPFKAGQFCMVQVPKEGERPLKKAYSVCSSPFEEGYIDLCIKLVEGGFATHWFWTLKENDPLTITLPYGAFVLKEPLDTDLIFVATGTGLAPLRSMIRVLLRENYPKNITLIFGVRYEDELIYRDEFLDFEKQYPHFKFIPTLSRPRHPESWSGGVGYVQEQLKKHFPSAGDQKIFVCGLVPMIESVEKTALELGFDKKQIHFEKYV